MHPIDPAFAFPGMSPVVPDRFGLRQPDAAIPAALTADPSANPRGWPAARQRLNDEA